MHCSPPGSSVHELFQARILEWVVISSSREFPDPGIEPMSPVLAGGTFTNEPLGKAPQLISSIYINGKRNLGR